MYFDKFRSGEDTGSVAIKTTPKANEPITRCQIAFKLKNGMVASDAKKLNTPAIKTPPITAENIVRQLPTPVPIKIAAPRSMQITDVSPILPGINPMVIPQ